jgi:hypothetical protein
MEVIRHQDVGLQDDLVGLGRRLEQREELASVVIVNEDGLSPVTPAGNVVDSAGKLHSERSRHDAQNTRCRLIVKSQDLTPQALHLNT